MSSMLVDVDKLIMVTLISCKCLLLSGLNIQSFSILERKAESQQKYMSLSMAESILKLFSFMTC